MIAERLAFARAHVSDASTTIRAAREMLMAARGELYDLPAELRLLCIAVAEANELLGNLDAVHDDLSGELRPAGGS